MRRLQRDAPAGNICALEGMVNECEICGHKSRTKSADTAHRRKEHPVVTAAGEGDRIGLLRALIVTLATKAEGADERSLPSIARQLVNASTELEDAIGKARSLAELQAEVARLKKTQPKEKSRVDDIAERRAARRAKTARR